MKEEKRGSGHTLRHYILAASVFVLILTGSISFPAFAEVETSDEIQVSDWSAMQAAVSSTSQNTVKIRVVNDITVSSGNAHNAGNTVEIDLDGHTIDANSKQAFWNEKGSMTIKNGTIKNGKTDYGGAINNRGLMVLEDVDITNCTGNEAGGGIMNYGTLTMTGGSITNCQAGRGAALRIVPHGSDSSEIAQSATATLTNVTISGNTVDGRNDNYGRGGAIGVSNGTLTMIGCTVTDNKSTNDDGGAIDFDSSGKTLTLENTVISNNSVTKADRQGGGLNLERGDAVISGCTISGNSASDGGGIYIAQSFGNAVISGTTIRENNSTTYGGGGINNNAALVIKENSIISGNTCKEGGAGIWTNKALTVENTEISDNECINTSGTGGGIKVAGGTADLSKVTITGNTGYDGGGICVVSGASATVSGTSFITGNHVLTGSGGGVINKGTLTLKDNITITGNTAEGNGGGIYYNGSGLNMQGKIIVNNNTVKDDVNNTFLFTGKTITITGLLDGESAIGVTPASGHFVITKDFTESGNTNINVFSYDGGWPVILNEEGEVRISVSGGESVGQGVFNCVTVTIHPAGEHSTLNIRDNGRTAGQNAVQLYNIGDTQRFWLTTADDESYYIDYFNGANDYTPSTKRFDISDNGGYGHVGNTVHVVKGNRTDTNKRWIFIRNEDGTYYVQNKRSKLFWALEKSGYDDGNELVQKKMEDAQKWEIEIIAADGEIPVEELKVYDSFTYYLNGEMLTSSNWMSHLPDDMILSDVSMPGTHDAATARCTNNTGCDPINASSQCQNLSIHDQLYNGIRYFDLRLEGDELKLVHGHLGIYCRYKDEYLKLPTVMSWVFEFLDRNPGETVILQVKEDKGGDETKKAAYKYFKEIAENHPERIYIGDHVPRMLECRGKILIFSRLGHDYADFDIDGGQWALDVSDWPSIATIPDVGKNWDDPLALAASGENYMVWDQDEYELDTELKWRVIEASIFDYATGPGAVQSFKNPEAKDAWVVSYTSASLAFAWPFRYPQALARDLNPRVKEMLRKDYIIEDAKFLGVVCSDFSDEQLAYLVYKQNFIDTYSFFTIKGVTADGKEPFRELHMQTSTTAIERLSYAITQEKIRKCFTNEEYAPYGTGLQMFCSVSPTEINSAEEYAAATADQSALEGKKVLYVALVSETKANRMQIELPKCFTSVNINGTDWSSQDPKPVIRDADGHALTAYWAKDKNGTTPFAGPVITGTMNVKIVLEPEWGYYWDETETEVIISSTDGSYKNTFTITEENFKEKQIVLTGIPIAHQALHLVQRKAATCKDYGVRTHYWCEYCNNFFLDAACTEQIDESNLRISRTNEHTPGEAVVENITEATCTEAGSYDQVVYCTVCGDELSRETREIPALGHEWDEGTVTTAPTCTEPGVLTYTCLHDGTHTKTEEIAAIGHAWGEWEATVGPTVSTDGEEVRVCQNNPLHTETRIIPSGDHKHDLFYVAAKNATCEGDGNIGYWTCSRCGLYFADEAASEQLDMEDIILPGGHDWDEGVVTTKAGCTTEGVITYTCKRDSSHKKTESIPATGHTDSGSVVYQDVSAATCTQPELKFELHYCKDCGALIESRLVETGPALGHDWGETKYTWSADLRTITATRTCKNDSDHVQTETVETIQTVTPATCEEDGKITYTAAFNNKAFEGQSKEEILPKLGHEWDKGTVTTAPTCTKEGVLTFTCTHDASHTKTEVISATGHTEKIRELDDDTATCTENGVRTVEHYCSVCNEVLSTESVETSPHGHLWGTLEYTWAEDNSTITGTVVCDICGETITETVNVTKEDTGCIRTWYGGPFENTCFETQEKVEILPDKHDWGEWEVTKDATCTEDGEETRVCAFDNSHVETRTNAALGHDWDEGVITRQPTAKKAGIRTFTCKRDPSHTRTESVPYVEVTKLKLNKTSADLAVGKTLQLEVTITPENATDKTVTWKSSNTSAVTVDSTGKVKAKIYSKTAVTITATSADGKKASCKIQTRFSDVTNPKASYYTPVYWAVDKGITAVTKTFRPDDPVTRGEFVAFLWRMAGKPSSTAKVNFKDVKTTYKFYDAIRWAVGKGIIKGYSDKTFRPDNIVSRGDIALMIWRYAKKAEPKSLKSPFSDLKYSRAEYYKAILWGAEKGIIKGSGGQFLRKNSCTRGQVVTFLYRLDHM